MVSTLSLVLVVVSVIDVVPHSQAGLVSSYTQKHRNFDGEWIIPFEIYEQRYNRSISGGTYSREPYMVDLNGDGLLDQIYSSYEPNTSTPSLSQYIKLQRPDGSFQQVYTCSQINGAGGKYYYSGHCAEPGYVSGTELAYEVRWTPLFYLYQQVAEHTYTYGSSGVSVQLFNWSYDSYDYQRDRKMPVFRDLNGDGLNDVIFQANWRHEGYSTTSANVNMILYNNGNGFDPGKVCLQVNLNPSAPAGSPEKLLSSLIPNGSFCLQF